MTELTGAALLRAAAARCRELDQAATPGPWQHVDYADPAGQPMTSQGDPSTHRGCGSVITMGEDVAGGDICAPNGDLYPRGGYSPLDDMTFIAAFRAVAAPLADLLDGIVANTEQRGGQPREPVYALCRAILAEGPTQRPDGKGSSQ